MDTLERVDACLADGTLSKEVHGNLRPFFATFMKATDQEGMSVPLLEGFLDCVIQQVAKPHPFSSYHERILSPYNYYLFGMEFIHDLIIEKESTLQGTANLDQMMSQIKKGENVILFGNHQTEPDPQIVSLLLEENYPKMAEDIIFVAGSRVTTDPIAVPFSLGRNLLCIHSKRYINHPPEERSEKQRHNVRTMNRMSELLQEGGKCIYVAPSGGRDRAGANGMVEVSPFDSSSTGMFLLMAKQAKTPTHFYPLALSTYPLMPPPDKVVHQLGELRQVFRTPVHISFGQELDLEQFPGCDAVDRKGRREALAAHIFHQMKTLYEELPK